MHSVNSPDEFHTCITLAGTAVGHQGDRVNSADEFHTCITLSGTAVGHQGDRVNSADEFHNLYYFGRHCCWASVRLC